MYNQVLALAGKGASDYQKSEAALVGDGSKSVDLAQKFANGHHVFVELRS